jgi:beta-galactosidase
VIQPNFFWDFGPQTPRGPGKHVAIFSNCERLELFVASRPYATLHPDTTNYPYIPHAPFFAELDLDGSSRPELRIDGYVGNRMVLSRSFSSDPARDRLLLAADDGELRSDIVDATRLVFKVEDRFGAERAFANGIVVFDLSGPGRLVGDNPFSLEDSGGVGALWVRTIPGQIGRIRVKGTHSSLSASLVEINVTAAG